MRLPVANHVIGLLVAPLCVGGGGGGDCYVVLGVLSGFAGEKAGCFTLIVFAVCAVSLPHS